MPVKKLDPAAKTITSKPIPFCLSAYR